MVRLYLHLFKPEQAAFDNAGNQEILLSWRDGRVTEPRKMRRLVCCQNEI
jgi:hypothetical protein